MDLGLTGKRALVVGGSRGLGKALAHELVAEGAAVVLAARSEGPLREAVDEIAALRGTSVEAIFLDVCDPQSVHDGVDRAASLLGGIDIS